MAYSDAEKLEALIVLAVNRYNFAMTASDIGIPERTLRNWASAKSGAKKGIPELLERAIERMLMHIPEHWSGHDWAIAIGILIDKWQLIRGEPTERRESVHKIFERLQELSDDELTELQAEFQAIASGKLAIEPGDDQA